jgi:archaellum component FlaF (FlaF/FlaG flagellin family)
VVLNPQKVNALLPRTYILPGETLSVAVEKRSAATSVTLMPATLYGFSVDSYEALLVANQP